MGYFSTFAISAAGMQSERVRLDVAAQNIANMDTTRTSHGGAYIPLSVNISSKKSFASDFDRLGNVSPLPQATIVEQKYSVPRLVYEPTHPDANSDGFVAYPGVDTVTEMMNITTALRAYEANVVAINASKSMAMKAIELGSGV